MRMGMICGYLDLQHVRSEARLQVERRVRWCYVFAGGEVGACQPQRFIGREATGCFHRAVIDSYR